MISCPSCASPAPAGSRFCPSCAGPLAPASEAETRTSGLPASSPSSPSLPPSLDSLDRSRFIPGTMLAGRYRIVGLLGRGGMGEVYRADDLKLGQPVALKFLPAELERDRDRLTRLLNEVKLARQVAHPNVCRVYDVGEVDGHHFISMEYVDGENLASLLKQIGRLPRDKAVQLSRQICAGLGAAHDQGILHRDLKPANVMIDGRGRARITDFGLAEIAGQTRAEDARSGTPQYMAPEQLTDGRVSIKSDLYSLGLVLYELFTGKRAFDANNLAELTRLHEHSTPTSPSSHVEGFDPAVERVLLQCLEKEPAERPASALSIAAALPGGDPLAAALAAGETPSPEMVAAAGPKGGLHPGVAVACVAITIVGTVAMMAMSTGFVLYDRISWTKSYDALADDAREIVVELGHEEPPGDSAAWFRLDQAGVIGLSQAEEDEPGPEFLDLPGQDLVTLTYRQRAGRLVPNNLSGSVSPSDPPPLSGDVTLGVDLRGKLVSLSAPPPFIDRSPDPAPETDWAGLLEHAGLDLSTFEEAEPTLRPLLHSDARRAWTGMHPDQDDRPIRIEAASTNGKPVFFRIVDRSDSEWLDETATKEAAAATAEETAEPDTSVIEYAFAGFVITIFVVIVGGALLLVVRNLKLGRGDRKGAMRLALLVVMLRLLNWLFTGHHVANPDEIYLLVVALVGAIGLGVLVWVLYIALEPYIRRVWPQAIVSWSRALSYRIRDPLVGRDVLLGTTISIALGLASWVLFRVGISLDLVPILPQVPLAALRGGRHALGQPFSALLASIAFGLAIVIFFALLRIILRRTGLAIAAFCVLYGVYMSLVFTFLGGGTPKPGVIPLALGLALINTIGIVILLIRLGLLATMALFFTSSLMSAYPVTFDVSAPYFASALLGPLIIVAISVYAAKLALAGRPLFTDDTAVAGTAPSG